MHLIIGAGGVASWLVPLLKRMTKPGTEFLVCDGDIIEPRNLDRHLFSSEYIGWNKAEALADIYGLRYQPNYLEPDGDWLPMDPYSAIWCCADNHVARALVLEQVDHGVGHMAIIGGNEYTDAEAYGYLPAWKNTTADPRIYYPELLTDQSNDPLNPACQGINQAQNRQLALANYLAAGFMVHLWWFITNHGQEVLLSHWPVRHWSNFTSFNSKPYEVTPLS
jgi:hypothetical protein